MCGDFVVEKVESDFRDIALFGEGIRGGVAKGKGISDASDNKGFVVRKVDGVCFHGRRDVRERAHRQSSVLDSRKMQASVVEKFSDNPTFSLVKPP